MLEANGVHRGAGRDFATLDECCEVIFTDADRSPPQTDPKVLEQASAAKRVDRFGRDGQDLGNLLNRSRFHCISSALSAGRKPILLFHRTYP
jgi:hypothetical protein